VKLMRIGPVGQERPAVAVGADRFVDVGDLVPEIDGDFLAGGGPRRIADEVAAREAAGRSQPLAGHRIGAPIARPHQILAIGLNYTDHAAETNSRPPREPILFMKSPNSLNGPYDDVHIPRGSTKPDWEVELGVVIGRRCRYLADEHEALAAVAGYVCVNDVSERAFQTERGGQWSKGKSAETFNPCGPFLVTADEVPDPQALDMWLEVNGVRRQNGSTANMIFGVGFLVHYLSQFMVLEPGDLIDTGTPAGVGLGFQPPIWLQPDDVIELEISGLGRQRTRVIPAP
jgi:2,4-didehydro-3-deoxy-L-rhamnonate hydrolase